MHTAMMARESIPVMINSWSADWQALSCRFCPRYWEDTTAPPVATAANILMNRVLTISTRDTPEVAASPTLDTIMVSTIPTDTARICSTISGNINLLKSALENMYPPGFLFSMYLLPSSSHCAPILPQKNDAECYL